MSAKPYDVDILKRIEDELLDDTRITNSQVNVKFSKKNSDIRTFFADKTILITGATGFLGKVIMEKLLRSCPEIEGLLLLVREKKGKSVNERIEEMFNEPIFELLKKEQPKVMKKIHVIPGDIMMPGLGIGIEDIKLIVERVSVIIHSAATVKFNETLAIAARINVNGTKELLDVGKQCKNLKAFCHISTAYANCVQRRIDEVFYDPPMKADDFMQLVQTKSEQELAKMTDSLLGEFPNTYAYTKAIAEDLVREYGKGLPVSVFRPSIIIATYREPVRGWIDNLYGPTGVLVGAGLGIIKTLRVDKDVLADLVPVDMVVNALVSSIWETAKIYSQKSKSDIPIYNYVSSCQKPITWGEFMNLNRHYGMQVPSTKAIWYYCLTLNKNIYAEYIYRIFLHYLPALLYDAMSIIRLKKPKMIGLYHKIHEFSQVITYFSTQYWKFTNNNILSMWDKLNACDKRVFNFDMSQLDWDYHSQTYIPGVRVYLVKEDFNNLKEAKKKWQRLKHIHNATKVLAVLFAAFFVCYFFASLLNFLF